MRIYDFTVKDNSGENVSLDRYEGEVLLVVNTATKCGFTPQYEGLQALYNTYAEKGFEILDFPSNQFLNQAPGDDEQIEGFCSLNYGTTFPRFAKVDVNGKNAEPLFDFLKASAPEPAEKKRGLGGLIGKVGDAMMGDDIRWNFTKFLVDRSGKVVGRFGPTVTPEQLENAVASLV